MSSSDSRTNPEFQYPPAQADRSLTSLDFDTLIMKSTARRLPEQPGSSLDDSTYEMLTDSLIETSDDEAHTASIASTSDERTPDDVSTFSDDDDDDNDFEKDHPTLEESTRSMHASTAHDELETPMATSGDDSMLTMVPDHLESSRGSRMVIHLDEESTHNGEASLGSAVLRAFPSPQEMPKILEMYEQPQVRVVVKAALSSHYLSTPETYRILFLGLPDTWVQDDIVAHIHAALTRSSSNTRSVMVRGQMEPLGTVIDSQSCVELKSQPANSAGSSFVMLMANGQLINFSRREAPPYDLVVLCQTHKRNSDPGLQVHDLRSVFRQHQIPLIELTDIKPYGAGTAEYDGHSLAVCMEGRSDDGAAFELLEVLPLDAYKFCEIDPAQINRHLALLSPRLATPALQAKPRTSLAAMTDTLCAIGKQLRTGAPAPTKVLLLSLALVAMLSAFVLSPVYMPLVLQKPTDMAADSSAITNVPVSSPLVTPPAVSSLSVFPVSSLSSSSALPNGLTLVPPVANAPKPKPKPNKNKDEKSGGFEIQTAGEKQFVLTPSKELASSRKKPQLQIQVFRSTTSVPVRYVRTISGEYFVDLEDEYPFGAFNVSVASYSKPLLRQSFEIRLGHNRTWYEQMVGDATERIILARSVLLELSSSAVEQTQAKLNNVVGPKVSKWVRDGRRLEEAAHGAARDGLVSGAQFIKHVPETTWANLRKATAPVRLSQTMWKARINALQLRCNVETAAGKMLKQRPEQLTQTCEELQALKKRR